MYDWLTDSLQNSATLVTANRRLARSLQAEFSTAQVAAGHSAWRSPQVTAWHDWCDAEIRFALAQETLPTRINAQQSQWLWERCLRKSVGDSHGGIGNLVRLARETWQRMADWQVSIRDVAATAQTPDQELFAAVAGRYLAILEHENQVDDAGVAPLLLELIQAGRVAVTGTFIFVGFDRQRPVAESIHAAICAAGGQVQVLPAASLTDSVTLQSFRNSDAELRAAGVWARNKIDAKPSCRIAIISNHLESNADEISRLVRDGMTPGWQYGHASLFDALNVSFGRRLSDFPAIGVALLLLRWLVKELSAKEVSLLLRLPLSASPDIAGRCRLELRLRQLPDRAWKPAMISAALRGKDDDGDGQEWLAAIAKLSKRRREVPQTATPAEWASFIDETLSALNWPGQGTLDSDAYQLLNRWRELLNEFARLDLVSGRMNFGAALSRLELLAGDTVFQVESTNARAHLMGPLEAAGAEFDAVWICGLSSANWPPAGAPSVLLSRRLQEKHEMPDATPADTMHYARLLLARLIGSGAEVACSYAVLEDDTEQSVSDLLSDFHPEPKPMGDDQGWHASSLMIPAGLCRVDDPVPPISSVEKLSGGAGTIQRQLTDPITAFVHGRLGARRLYPQTVGISPPMRGNLIHDALYKLYLDSPNSDDVRSWEGADLSDRIAVAVDFAFVRHERQTDAVLQHVLALERQRVASLLRQFVVIDGNRGSFKVASVEGMLEFVAGSVRLPLRFDRIDTFDDGSVAILDYKTGAKKQLLNKNKEPQEIQLFVYANATDASVSALALVNVDSREIVFSGAGRGYGDEENWSDILQRIKQQIEVACDEFAAGDVRINIEQGVQSSRPLNLLSRYTELRRDNG